MEVGECVFVVEADEGEDAWSYGGYLLLIIDGSDACSFDSLDDEFHCGGVGDLLIEDGDDGEEE